MRDAIIIPFSKDESLVITSDNSGAIGMKELDEVKVPYETVGYFSLRVAVMECMAAGATPITVVIQNFCGDDDWNQLMTGVQNGLVELEMEDIPVTGSTESNFSLKQSAVGINIIGKKSTDQTVRMQNAFDREIALIGLPLVGDEVVLQSDQIVPLSIFRRFFNLQNVDIWPVGSKGVLSELKRMIPNFDENTITSNLDLLKSGGPSTSFLAVYPKNKSKEIRKISGSFFHKL